MKTIWICLVMVVPFICDGQDSTKILAKEKGVKLKPGQEENLLKVFCIYEPEDWGAFNAAAEYAMNDRSSIKFPEFGKTYTVMGRTRDGFYQLLEIGIKTMWDASGFVKVNQIETK